jgi:hypothetical protein
LNSNVVSAEIKRIIRPSLKDLGFTTFAARNAWRRRNQVAEVVNFQSFGMIKAQSLGCTTFSFCVNLGIYYYAVHDAPWGSKYPPTIASRPERPFEHWCQARNHLKNRQAQPAYPRPDIWFVQEDGAGLGAVIEDARNVIVSEGQPWFEEYGDIQRVIAHFLTPRSQAFTDDFNPLGYVSPLGSLGAARNGAPVALAAGNVVAAHTLWRAVMENPFYAKRPHVLEEAKYCLSALRSE